MRMRWEVNLNLAGREQYPACCNACALATLPSVIHQLPVSTVPGHQTWEFLWGVLERKSYQLSRQTRHLATEPKVSLNQNIILNSLSQDNTNQTRRWDRRQICLVTKHHIIHSNTNLFSVSRVTCRSVLHWCHLHHVWRGLCFGFHLFNVALIQPEYYILFPL